MVSDYDEIVVYLDPGLDIELLQDLRRRLPRNVELDKHQAEFDSAPRLMLFLPGVERDGLEQELLERPVDLAFPSIPLEANAVLGPLPSLFEFGGLVAELLAQGLDA